MSIYLGEEEYPLKMIPDGASDMKYLNTVHWIKRSVFIQMSDDSVFIKRHLALNKQDDDKSLHLSEDLIKINFNESSLSPVLQLIGRHPNTLETTP